MNPHDRSTNSPKRIRLAAPPSPPPPEPYRNRICYPNCCWLPPASSRVMNLAVGRKPNPSQMRRFPPAVAINSYREASDANILMWQENQISRSIIENTVNRVVESYIEDHFGDDDDDDDDAAAGAELALASPTLERSAINAAIIEHGLRQSSVDAGAADAVGSVAQDGNGMLRTPPNDLQRLQELCAAAAASGSSSAGSTGESGLEEDRDENGVDDDVAAALSSAEATSDESDAEHNNFMEAAVSAAIQKKGLSSSASASSASHSAVGGGGSRSPNR